jgi:hypothetical protein
MLHLWDPPGTQVDDADLAELEDEEEPEMIAHQSLVIASVEVLVA